MHLLSPLSPFSPPLMKILRRRDESPFFFFPPPLFLRSRRASFFFFQMTCVLYKRRDLTNLPSPPLFSFFPEISIAKGVAFSFPFLQHLRVEEMLSTRYVSLLFLLPPLFPFFESETTLPVLLPSSPPRSFANELDRYVGYVKSSFSPSPLLST